MLREGDAAIVKGLAGGALLWTAARGSWLLRAGAAAAGTWLLVSAWEDAQPRRPKRLLKEPASVDDDTRVDESSWESFPASDPPGY